MGSQPSLRDFKNNWRQRRNAFSSKKDINFTKLESEKEKEIASLKAGNAAVGENDKVAHETCEEEIMRLKEKVNGLCKVNQDRKADVEDMEDEITSLEASLAQREDEITNLKADVEQRDWQVEDLEKNLNRMIADKKKKGKEDKLDEPKE